MMRICLLGVVFIVLACASDSSGDDDSGGWTRHPGNPVLKPGRKTPGAPIGNDYYNLSDPCVVKDDGVYKMWYTSSGPTTALAVNHCNISYAESTDGVSWTKYEGNPVLDANPSSWDEFAVETVAVLLDDDAPASERFKMWYAGRTSETPGDPAYDIGYAWSTDGKAWTKHSAPVLVKGAADDWDNHFLEGPSVIKDGATFKMWYAAMDAIANDQASDGKVCIGYAESTDGIVWVKHEGPVLVTGGSGTWDFVTVQDPCVLKVGASYCLWYGGKTSDVKNYGQRMGFASSSDGITWNKSASNPFFGRGAPGSWDAVTASYAGIILDGDVLKMWYTGMDKDYDPPDSIPDYWEIGYAYRILEVGNLSE